LTIVLPPLNLGESLKAVDCLSLAVPMRALFIAEMIVSPIVAAIAYLVPVAANWGQFKYLPAIVWFAIFVQCLFTFRWRGLWFLLGIPVAGVAITAFLLAAPPVPSLDPPVVKVQ